MTPYRPPITVVIEHSDEPAGDLTEFWNVLFSLAKRRADAKRPASELLPSEEGSPVVSDVESRATLTEAEPGPAT